MRGWLDPRHLRCEPDGPNTARMETELIARRDIREDDDRAVALRDERQGPVWSVLSPIWGRFRGSASAFASRDKHERTWTLGPIGERGPASEA